MAKMKELAGRIKQAKEKMTEDSGPNTHHITECTQHSGDGVALCLYSRKDSGTQRWMQSTVCHAEVARLGYMTDFILDHIQDMKGYNKNPLTEEEGIALLQYYMDHPIFAQSFHEHDAKKAYEEKIMVRNLEGLPSNATMFCLIGTRALWESFQNKVPHRFSVLLNQGFTPDEAFILSYFVQPADNGDIKLSPIAASGHSVINTNQFTVEHLANFLKYKMTNVSNLTLGEGGSTSGRNGVAGNYYCVDNLFAGPAKEKIRDMFDHWDARYKADNLLEILKGNKLSSGFLKDLCKTAKEKHK